MDTDTDTDMDTDTDTDMDTDADTDMDTDADIVIVTDAGAGAGADTRVQTCASISYHRKAGSSNTTVCNHNDVGGTQRVHLCVYVCVRSLVCMHVPTSLLSAPMYLSLSLFLSLSRSMCLCVNLSVSLS